MTKTDQANSQAPIVVGVVVALLIIIVAFFAFRTNNEQGFVANIPDGERQAAQDEQQLASTKTDANIELQDEPNTTGELQPTSEPTNSEQNSTQETHYLFYGETCPHCHDTMEWMEENIVGQQLTVIKKEVYSNQDNAKQLNMAAANCGEKRAGVPFLYTPDQECHIGTPNIKNYFAGKLGIASE
jgi:glutaredoxin